MQTNGFWLQSSHCETKPQAEDPRGIMVITPLTKTCTFSGAAAVIVTMSCSHLSNV